MALAAYLSNAKRPATQDSRVASPALHNSDLSSPQPRRCCHPQAAQLRSTVLPTSSHQYAWPPTRPPIADSSSVCGLPGVTCWWLRSTSDRVMWRRAWGELYHTKAGDSHRESPRAVEALQHGFREFAERDRSMLYCTAVLAVVIDARNDVRADGSRVLQSNTPDRPAL